MSNMIANHTRVSSTFALFQLADGTYYEIRGDEAHVDRTVARYLAAGYIVDNVRHDALSTNTPASNTEFGPEGDPREMQMPTVNWKTGEIERAGKPIVERPILRQSTPLWMLNQNTNVVRGPSDESQPAYVRPTMDFSDRQLKR